MSRDSFSLNCAWRWYLWQLTQHFHKHRYVVSHRRCFSFSPLHDFTSCGFMLKSKNSKRSQQKRNKQEWYIIVIFLWWIQWFVSSAIDPQVKWSLLYSTLHIIIHKTGWNKLRHLIFYKPYFLINKKKSLLSQKTLQFGCNSSLRCQKSANTHSGQFPKQTIDQ